MGNPCGIIRRGYPSASRMGVPPCRMTTVNGYINKDGMVSPRPNMGMIRKMKMTKKKRILRMIVILRQKRKITETMKMERLVGTMTMMPEMRNEMITVGVLEMMIRPRRSVMILMETIMVMAAMTKKVEAVMLRPMTITQNVVGEILEVSVLVTVGQILEHRVDTMMDGRDSAVIISTMLVLLMILVMVVIQIITYH